MMKTRDKKMPKNVKTEASSPKYSIAPAFVNVNESFKCTYCPESFTFKSQLIIHEMSHKVKINCQVCSKRIYKENQKEHMDVHLKNKCYFCNFCNAEFASKTPLLIHLRSQHIKSKRFHCYCGKGFNDTRHFRNHMITHIEERPFKCDLCGKKYKQKQLLEFHMIGNHQSERKLRCTFCNFMAGSFKELNKHRQDHLQKYQCLKCDKIFKERRHAKTHFDSTHLKLQNYQCLVCDKTMVSEKNVKFHLKSVHKASIDRFKKLDQVSTEPCYRVITQPLPNKSIILNQETPKTDPQTDSVDQPEPELNLPIQNVIKEEPVSLDPLVIKPEPSQEESASEMVITPYQPRMMSFSSLIYAEKTKEKSFACSFCSKIFQERSQLILHEPKCQLKIQEGIYKCEYCPKSFNDEFTHEIHVNTQHIHTKVHKCNDCDFTTTKFFAFRTHKMTHMSFVKCEKCEKMFRNNDLLHEHERDSHAIRRTYKCNTCHVVFQKQSVLDRHMNTSHGTRNQDLVKIVRFTATEVNSCTIKSNNELRLLPRNHQSVHGKISYNSILTQKLQAISATKSVFKISEGWKKSGRLNKVSYVICEHDQKMPISYKAHEHQLSQPLTFKIKLSCLPCAGLERTSYTSVAITSDKKLTLSNAIEQMRKKIMKYFDKVEQECGKEMYPVDYFVNKTEEHVTKINSCIFEAASDIRHQLDSFGEAFGVNDDESEENELLEPMDC